LMCYLGISYSDAYRMPIQYRTFFIRRLNEEIKKSVDAGGDPPTRPAHDNTPMMRQMLGQPPGRRRF
jgi:hypothetical protein